MRRWGKISLLLAALQALSSACSSDRDVRENASPKAAFSVERGNPLVVAVDGSESVDDDGSLAAYRWDFGDGSQAEGSKAQHQYERPGCYEVSLEVFDNEGAMGSAKSLFRIIASVGNDTSDVDLFGMPSAGALIPRDVATNLGTLQITGTTPAAQFESAVARVFLNDELESQHVTELCSSSFALNLPIVAERKSRRVEVFLRGLETELPLGSAQDIVSGDIFLINGQSNAVSSEFEGSADENRSAFVRTFGARTERLDVHASDNDWRGAIVGDVIEGRAAVGQWPLRMASKLSEQFDLPIGLINSAHGGRPIAYFARNDENPMDITTNYGRMLDRSARAGVLGKSRAILFYQGESDGGFSERHRQGFVNLHESWLEDFPNVEKFYVSQIRLGCGGAIETREVQRQLSTLENTSVMSTTGLDGHDGCHFAYERGYRELGDRYAALLARDLYGVTGETDLEAVDVLNARLDGDRIIIRTRGDASALVVDEGNEEFFTLFGGSRAILDIKASGKDLILNLGAGQNPTHVGYLGHSGAGPWITNARGVGLLAFFLPLEVQ